MVSCLIATLEHLKGVAKIKGGLDFCNPFQVFHYCSSLLGSDVVKTLKGITKIKHGLGFCNPLQVFCYCSSSSGTAVVYCSSEKPAQGAKFKGGLDFLQPLSGFSLLHFLLGI